MYLRREESHAQSLVSTNIPFAMCDPFLLFVIVSVDFPWPRSVNSRQQFECQIWFLHFGLYEIVHWILVVRRPGVGMDFKFYSILHLRMIYLQRVVSCI